jgi:hypothetical protein
MEMPAFDTPFFLTVFWFAMNPTSWHISKMEMKKSPRILIQK